MSVILITNKLGGTSRVHLGLLMWLFISAIGLLLLAGAAYVGMQMGGKDVYVNSMLTGMQKSLEAEQLKIETATQEAEKNVNALAVRLGQLQAHVIRLDALGQRLIENAKLDRGEFDFANSPALGGPESAKGERGSSIKVPDFLSSLEGLSEQLEHRSLQLGVLETMLMNRDLQDEVFPAGRPVKRGWVSSYYGKRTDPFNGRIAHHDGIDIAGKHGSEVIAVAAGVVTWAGKRYGYGQLVEINHGNGYATRYGHNDEIVVRVGETVKKGDTISKMGSSGRSTGPHVHFEVHKNGRTVDPIKYVRASR